MAVRQYIGARYTIKVYENSVDPSTADWQSGVAYEPITLVTYNNSSYLSKKDVPASVGDPASNPSYWVCTGYYNGQIMSLQSQIDAIVNSTIPAIQNALNAYRSDELFNAKTVTGKMIFISDSYNTKLPTGTFTVGEKMREFGGYSASEFLSYGYDGSGFVKDSGYGTFLDRFTADTALLSADVKNSIRTIYIAAGRNDYESTAGVITWAIGQFVNFCKTNYPNARVRVSYIGNGNNTNAGSRVQQFTAYTGYANSQTVGADYIAGGEAILKNAAYMQSDYIHPNDNGRAALAKYLLQGLKNGKISVNYPEMQVDFTITNADVTTHVESGNGFKTYVEDGIIYIKPSWLGQLDFASGGLIVSAGQFTTVTLGNISSGYMVYPVGDTILPIPDAFCYMYNGGVIDTSSPRYDFTFRLFITAGGEVKLGVFSVGVNGNIGRILFKNSILTGIPASYC